MFKIGAIGAGHMGMAVLDAIKEHGLTDAADILVYDLDSARRKSAKSKGYTAAGSEIEVYTNCEMLMLAVRPQDCDYLAVKLEKCVARREDKPVIINIMAGISSEYIRDIIGADTAVISVMPTLGMVTGNGAAAIAKTENVPYDAIDYITKIFAATGDAVHVNESELKEIVAVNGCMPGYVLYLLDAFARSAEEYGIEYNMAIRMAARGFIGAAEQILGGGDAKELLLRVCTPGGLTSAGVDSFVLNRMDKIIENGMSESIRRGYELGK